MKKIRTALISVFHKEGLQPIIEKLKELNATIYSTGGTQQYIESLGAEVQAVEKLTSYPSILGGRVKTLHPKVFGGILARSENEQDHKTLNEYDIPAFDLVIVDLYPFEKTVADTSDESEIIEKIDIGGISLIRAAAKNYRDVAVVSNQDQYPHLLNLLTDQNGSIHLDQRKWFALQAFNESSHYDTAIFNYFNHSENQPSLKVSYKGGNALRYGENPHQQAHFYGPLEDLLEQINGKPLSFNNLVDIDAAVHLISEFEKEPTFAILKHTNPCGLCTAPSLQEAYKGALAGDPISAFGGVLISNTPVDLATAEAMHPLFFEVLVAPGYSEEALTLLSQKKKRILLHQKGKLKTSVLHKTLLNGVIAQKADPKIGEPSDWEQATTKAPSNDELNDLHFALKAVKHLKSNTIVLAKNQQLLGMGCGQTSRIDALNQAVLKSNHFGFDLTGVVMASDAFFPFPDCVEVAHNSGIRAVVQPGGSIKDQDSIDFCDRHEMSMMLTGRRHFKH